uniref:Uncharacterized protein n=1 Tax=Fibrocapsa japonica TaxID=94617 RepID=A0A7S2V4L7_9STRA|mmetsp:Transcript_6854/g.10349  ORF Transcript_6854/g.10349 Transcript_6854/m.10349 type:complete len:214 (+) Transcript_6854:121-762(+)|eukprot:CAMPEP_0113934190 /NCGR_PEP_ID=MMETSP1339-20121228/1516_1 /TAXON_ID=94617 /ORGANISM="Fibrocapsa japonica" /LENGTH=213 /DNA_ID=CAMNT_0000935883 /DNA_START=121 /DNA_END=762 /DNA_ORIENTATION=+ /assembly_acc=CAM_ASM_000762
MFTKILAIASVAGMASAFVPAMPVAGVTKSTSSLQMSYQNEVGAQPPLGFWDPLGLLKDEPEERFNRLRYVEVKHGRIAMLAVLGHIVTSAGVRLPGYLSTSENLLFADMPTGLAALSKIPVYGLAQILVFIGFLELGVMRQREGSFPGDMTNPAPPAAWEGYSEATKLRKRAIELNNGRAAQMGILGLMVHEKLNNDPYVINSLLGMPVSFN